jgi:CheY-like chemotaxis protein
MTGRMSLAATTAVRLSGPGCCSPIRCEFTSRLDGSQSSNWGKKKAAPGEAAERQRVLVVDDEAIIADTVVEILNRSGYDAIARYSGRAALESIEEHCPSIVLSDVVMPGLNGIQLAQSVRKRCPSTRIVLFSGNAATARLLQDSSGTKHSFELLAKPIHPLELLKVLRS